MPYRNKCKTFVPDCYYHLYGRGVNRMDMFLEKEDYRLFCYLLKKYLSPDFKEVKIFKGQRVEVLANSVSGKVELYAFCFMPNHFHLLIKNIEKEGMSKLMTRVLSGYSRYFNQKYGRQGPLIQGTYRAVLVSSREQFVHVFRYIHLNPVLSGLSKRARDYEYSSHKNYLNKEEYLWLKLEPCLLDATDHENIESYFADIEEDPKVGIMFN